MLREKGICMKNTTALFVAGLLAHQFAHAQGTTYLSSLSPTITSTLPVGSDYWLGARFRTGDNPDGYLLDSVQLGMADASGNPNGFTVMLYSASGAGGPLPGSSLGTLSGSLNPTTAGIYTYTPASSLTLSPSTHYYVVLTAETPVASGAYSWSQSAFPPSIYYWAAGNSVLHSSDGGSFWTSEPSPYPYSGMAQFQINATLVPEPGTLSLLGLGLLAFGWRAALIKRRKEVNRD
jgi:hypothetical protein